MKIVDNLKECEGGSYSERLVVFTDCNVLEYNLVFYKNPESALISHPNGYPKEAREEVERTRLHINLGGIYTSSQPEVQREDAFILTPPIPTAHVVLTGDPTFDTDDNIFRAACYALRQVLPLKSQGDGGFEEALPRLINLVYGKQRKVTNE